VVLVVGFFVGVDWPVTGAEKKGASGLEGTWLVVSAIKGGKAEEGAKGEKVVFAGNTITVHAKNGEHKATVKIDPKKQTIDVTITEQGQTRVLKGLYQIKGDEMKFCHSRPGQGRPKELAAEKGSGNVLLTLKRDKSK
jgi:uncharacterized protein (TIGR03067 family)